MALEQDLKKIEEGFWYAAGAGKQGAYYREYMAEKGIAVMPEPYPVMTKQDAINMADEVMAPWEDVRIENPRFLPLGAKSVAMVYHGKAMRNGQPYSANITSVYVKDNGSWKLALHQQSPESKFTEESGEGNRDSGIETREVHSAKTGN
jgi:hypothetical protein